MEVFIVIVVFIVLIIATAKPSAKPSRHISSTPAQRFSLDLSIAASEKSIPKYFVFDLETTGLPLNYDGKASDLSNWPRVVQIAWMVIDDEFKLIEEECFIIKPYRYRISDEVAKIHGITHERAKAEGKTHNEVYPLFLEHLNGCEIVVCHNATFDVPIIECDLIRWNFGSSIIGKKRVVCTMRSGTNFCGLKKPRGKGFKYPKLSELYLHLCAPKYKNAEIEGLHDASFDTALTVKCLSALNDWRIPLIEPKIKL